MYSDQGFSSVFVSWTKQVCLQTRLKWWQWWGTPDIIWNRVPDRRRSKRKWTITKCCLTVCRSIEKRHGVWAGASVAGVQWLFMQHVSDIWWCSTAVAVVAQTSYFVSASYFDRKPMKWFKMYGYTRWHWKAKDYSSCIVLYPLQVGCHIMSLRIINLDHHTNTAQITAKAAVEMLFFRSDHCSIWRSRKKIEGNDIWCKLDLLWQCIPLWRQK